MWVLCWDKRAKLAVIPGSPHHQEMAGGRLLPPIPAGLLDGPAALLAVLPNRRAGVPEPYPSAMGIRFPRVTFRQIDAMGADEQHTNARSGSTQWAWKRVKIAHPPEASSRQPKAAHRWFKRPVWNGREKLTLTVTYRGGAEAWYEIHSRGCMGRFPGYVSLHDVMREIYNERRG